MAGVLDRASCICGHLCAIPRGHSTRFHRWFAVRYPLDRPAAPGNGIAAADLLARPFPLEIPASFHHQSRTPPCGERFCPGISIERQPPHLGQAFGSPVSGCSYQLGAGPPRPGTPSWERADKGMVERDIGDILVRQLSRPTCESTQTQFVPHPAGGGRGAPGSLAIERDDRHPDLQNAPARLAIRTAGKENGGCGGLADRGADCQCRGSAAHSQAGIQRDNRARQRSRSRREICGPSLHAVLAVRRASDQEPFLVPVHWIRASDVFHELLQLSGPALDWNVSAGSFAIITWTLGRCIVQMERDPILSRIAGTKPGQLSAGFYLKLA